jgi:hypothetical protein
MAEDVRIDYEKLAADYVQSLTIVLRNFQPSEFRFLETWVPDEDDIRSILGIMEAAKDNALPHISIHLGAATLSRVDLAELCRRAAQLGRITVEAKGEGIELGTSFPAESSGHIIARDGAAIKQRAGPALRFRTSEPVGQPFHPFVNRLVPRDNESTPIYTASLQRAAELRSHEGSLSPHGSLVSVQASRDGITLSALVDSSCHCIRQAAYQGAASANAHGLFETLCQLMENRPIIECNDHAVIFLEYELRDHSMAWPVPGIVTPENADLMFVLPTRLVRDLFADYCRRTGFNDLRNHYDQPVSERWQALSTEARAALLQDAMDQHPSGQGITLLRMESPKRVVVGFTDEVSASAKQSRLMSLEAHLQKTLEWTLHLCVEPRVDQNKLRRLKEAIAT